MPIELGGIELRRIHQLATLEQAVFVYHQVPGMEGALAQNMGRGPVRIKIEGILYGPEAQDQLRSLRELYLKREPVDFIADIVAEAYVSRVLLERFEVAESAYEPDQLSYSLVVAEYLAPAKQAVTQAVDAKIKVEADALLDVSALPDALAFGSLPEITNPLQPLNSALDPLREASGGLMDAVSGLKSLLGA